MARGTVNKTILLGRLGQDPEIRTTANGTQVANFSIATNENGGKDQNGQRQELTEWHKLIAFGKTAELAAQYLTKGSQVYIEGRLQTRKWRDNQGIDRYSTEIVVNEMQFIGGQGQQSQQPQQGFSQPQGGFGQQPQGGFNQPPRQRQAPQHQGGFSQPQQPPQQPGTDTFEDFSDDIPFSWMP